MGPQPPHATRIKHEKITIAAAIQIAVIWLVAVDATFARSTRRPAASISLLESVGDIRQEKKDRPRKTGARLHSGVPFRGRVFRWCRR
jgi:hypothetical protein